jgi:hypothetical protein
MLANGTEEATPLSSVTETADFESAALLSAVSG